MDKKLPNSVAIIGAGWLGKSLAKSLLAKGVDVVVSATSSQKVASLQAENLPATLVRAPDCLSDSLLQCQAWVICIPPGLRHGRTDYPQQIQALAQFAQQASAKPKHIVLISSTAVYNGLQGEVNEASKLNLNGDKVAVLHDAENKLLNADIEHATVLRLAGLFGYDRQPGRFFKDGRLISEPDSVVNMIHRDDVIALIECLLQQADKPAIVNGVSPHHPTRRAFYNKAFASLGKSTAEFAEQKLPQGKQVQSDFTATSAFNYKVNDLLAYFDNRASLEVEHG
ncbi:NAD(P)H-binding protein [Thalassotalea sp. HSM 43]|uniref:NAD(P)H-binding protein n=1 Tax=Thalassotalea sp. HSM 43 TaxID=2552945 RepID=UPI001673687D|nr:NAD(P)H-binding protein [Thalassotalea sp. HSM 43]